jgi:hypothetical protein
MQVVLYPGGSNFSHSFQQVCVSDLLQYLLPRCQRKRREILYQCEQIGFEVFVNENAFFFDLVNMNAKTGMTFKLGSKLLQMLQDGL